MRPPTTHTQRRLQRRHLNPEGPPATPTATQPAKPPPPSTRRRPAHEGDGNRLRGLARRDPRQSPNGSATHGAASVPTLAPVATAATDRPASRGKALHIDAAVAPTAPPHPHNNTPTPTPRRRRNSLAQRRKDMTPAAPPAAPPLAPPTTCRRHPMAATAKDRSASRSEAFLHPTADVTWRRRPPGPALHGKAEPLLQGDAPRAALSPSDHSRLCASGSATSSALVRSTSRRAPATTATSGPAREAFALALATTQHATPPSPTAPPAPARRHASR
ncbi:MAG: hypothetical protein ACKVI4_16520 [Actinomycetales bacterium]